MKHREILSKEENAAVAKFQEYNANVVITYGSKANWVELVHKPSLYSDELLSSKVTALRAKLNTQQQAEDEDGITSVAPEFTLVDGFGDDVHFSTQETLMFVRAARKVRKHMTQLVANKAAIAKLQTDMAKLKAKTATPQERLAEMQAQLDALLGKPAETQEQESQDPA